MDDNRPFPIQMGTLRDKKTGEYSRPITRYSACTIPWWLAEEAYAIYVTKGGRGQSLERLAERGGFARDELIALLQGGEHL